MGLRKKKSLLDQAEEYVEAAIDHAKDFIEDTARPALTDAKDRAAPVVTAAGADLAVRAGQARQLAEAKAAEVTGSKQKKRSKMKMFLLLGAIAGAVGVVAKRMQSGAEQSSPWQSDYTPPPAPAAVEDPVTEEDVVPPAAVDPTADATADPLTDPLTDEQQRSE